MPITPDSILLTGRRAVVTGAAQGIGAAVATTLARFGADVAICDRDADGLARTAAAIAAEGRHAHAELLDVRDADAVRGVDRAARPRRRARQQRGRRFPRRVPRREREGPGRADARELRERHALHPGVRRRRCPTTGGSIVNITSIEAHRAAPGYAVYSAMKAALVNLSQSLALELGDRRIRVNCIAPDVIPTPGIGGDLPVKTPLPYAGHVDDVAAAALYLASDWSRFVTGTTLHVDGGNLAAGGWGRGPDGGWVTSGEPVA